MFVSSFLPQAASTVVKKRPHDIAEIIFCLLVFELGGNIAEFYTSIFLINIPIIQVNAATNIIQHFNK